MAVLKRPLPNDWGWVYTIHSTPAIQSLSQCGSFSLTSSHSALSTHMTLGPHWYSWCFPSTWSLFLPSSLGTYNFLCLECSCPNLCMVGFYSLFRPLLREASLVPDYVPRPLLSISMFYFLNSKYYYYFLFIHLFTLPPPGHCIRIRNSTSLSTTVF
jgi:hypothetical protein